MNELHLIERQSISLEPDEWRRLSSEPGLWRAVSEGILEVSQTGSSSIILKARNHVGRLVFGDTLVEIAPKVSGAVEALFNAATPSLRVRQVSGPSSELGSFFKYIAKATVDHVRVYASLGRDWQYDLMPQRSSLIGGRLDVRGTVLLRARGNGHQVAFQRTVHSRATPLNSLVYRTLVEIDRLAKIVPIPASLLSEVNGLSMLFEDCAQHEIQFVDRPSLLRVAGELGSAEDGASRRALVDLCLAVLSHSSFEAESHNGSIVPIAWTVNLELLFEDAVRKRLKAQCDLPVRTGGSLSKFALRDPDSLEVNPDLAIGEVPCQAVGDVKYKNWEAAADAGDLYQLLVHARTLGAKSAFLVYPGDRLEKAFAGRTEDGISVTLYSLDVRDLDQGLASVIMDCRTAELSAAAS